MLIKSHFYRISKCVDFMRIRALKFHDDDAYPIKPNIKIK